ncbi:MAG: hypothetical protein NC910_04100 [Candidatus Omnitrophica bacterium]|nr:hypothetical protein [Candidatus Omnitrophota bacterium]
MQILAGQGSGAPQRTPAGAAAFFIFGFVLIFLVTITFLDFILLTPWAPFFFRLMGARVGRNVVVGLNSVVLPGSEIGDGATVAAGAILPKGTKIEAASTYKGIPPFVKDEEDQGNEGV